MTNIKIVNVVAKAKIAGFDIQKILESIEDTTFRQNNFPALGMNVNHSKIWLFDSGKIASLGCSIN